MTNTPNPADSRQLRDTKAVAGILVVGLLMTAACAVYLKWPLGDFWALTDFDIMTITALAVPVFAFCMAILLGAGIDKIYFAEWRRRQVTDGLAVCLKLWPLRNFMRLLALQFSALFAIVAFLMEERPLALVSFGVSVILILLLFPTGRRFQRWSEDLCSEIERWVI